MANYPSALAWKIPWTEELGRLQSRESLGVGHDWATSLSLFTFMHWRRKWHPTPVFLSGESQGRGSLVGCCLWGHTESDKTEVTQQQQQQQQQPCVTGFPWGSAVKISSPAAHEPQEIWVWSLGWEDPLEEVMATHSSVLAWRIPMDRGAWQATVHGVSKRQTWLSN